MKTIALHDGTHIPWLAWGNGTGKPRSEAVFTGVAALKADTAQGYNNQSETKEMFEQYGRGDGIYTTSKISQKNGSTKNKAYKIEDIRASVLDSIEAMGVTPDLWLVHNPFVFEDQRLVDGWRELEKLKDEGILKSLGVSNFRPQDFEILLAHCKHKPVVNQLEFHPYVLTHLKEVLELQEKHGIVTEAYGALSPLLRHHNGGRLKPLLTKIAADLSASSGKTVDEHVVLLLWVKAKNSVAVTTSGNPNNIQKMVDAADLDLTSDQVNQIDTIGSQVHFRAYDEHMSVECPAPNLPQE